MIKLEGVKHKILKIDSLEIKENTVILGPNGSGKSLLLGIITHEIYPERLNKREVFGKKITLKEARKIFGIVNSELECFYKKENISVFDAIISAFKEALVVYNYFKFNDLEKERVNELCELFKIKPSINVSTLSLGELKKVLIARALVHRPKILCLDEPTNGLDVKAKIEFLEMIDFLDEMKILITHDFKEITSYEKIVMLKKGRIFLEGRDILNYKNLSALFDVEIKKLKAFYG